MNADILLSSEYWLKIARRLFADILGPVGFVGLPIGVGGRAPGQAGRTFGLRFGAYLVIVAGGNFHHNYYQLPIVPMATVATPRHHRAGLTPRAEGWRDAQRSDALCGDRVDRRDGAFARSVSAHNWYELDAPRVALCDEVRPHLPRRTASYSSTSAARTSSSASTEKGGC